MGKLGSFKVGQLRKKVYALSNWQPHSKLQLVNGLTSKQISVQSNQIECLMQLGHIIKFIRLHYQEESGLAGHCRLTSDWCRCCCCKVPSKDVRWCE